MKKFRGSKYSHIGSTYTPHIDAMIDKLNNELINIEKHLDEIEKGINKLKGE